MIKKLILLTIVATSTMHAFQPLETVMWESIPYDADFLPKFQHCGAKNTICSWNYTNPLTIAKNVATIFSALILAKNLVQNLLSKSTTDMNEQAKKETRATIEETVTLLERLKVMLQKMSDVIVQADSLCIKISGLIEKLIGLYKLCV